MTRSPSAFILLASLLLFGGCRQKVSVHVDVLFDFSIVAGKGEVRQTSAGLDQVKRETKRIK